MLALSPAARQRLLIAVALAMSLEVLAVCIATTHASHPGVLAAALAVDVTLWLGLARWLSGPWNGSLRRALRLVFGALVACVAAARVAGVHVESALLPVVLAGELFALTAVGRAWIRSRGAEDPWRRAAEELEAILPAVASRALLWELRLMVEATRTLTARPLRKPAASDSVYPFMAASRSGWIIPFFVVASAVEVLALELFLGGVFPHAVWPRIALGALHLYGILWLVGERRVLWESAHRLEREVLVVSLGMRWTATISRSAIVRALVLRDDRDRAQVGKNLRLTPFDPPNLHLCLSEPVTFHGFFGLRRRAQHVDLFVDRPDVLAAALSSPNVERGD